MAHLPASIFMGMTIEGHGEGSAPIAACCCNFRGNPGRAFPSNPIRAGRAPHDRFYLWQQREAPKRPKARARASSSSCVRSPRSEHLVLQEIEP